MGLTAQCSRRNDLPIAVTYQYASRNFKLELGLLHLKALLLHGRNRVVNLLITNVFTDYIVDAGTPPICFPSLTSMSDPQITTAEKDDVKNTQADVEDDVEKGTGQVFYSKVSVYLMMVFSGLALGSDGYNAAVMSNLNLLLKVTYPDSLTADMRARLSNAFLIGMIVGMLAFGVLVDQLGRKTGAILTTLILLLGIALSTGASGTTPLGLFWMLVVARGIAGVGAGGEYPVAGTLSLLLHCMLTKRYRCWCTGGFG